TYSRKVSFEHSSKLYELVFEGIDTYSTVRINGKQLLTTNNSFTEYRIQLTKSDIKFGEPNLLEVQIYSTKNFDEAGNKQNKMPFMYAHTRKPAYQYSWDWAPYVNTMGIWKNVYVVEYESISIDYVWVRNRKVSELSAVLNFV